MQYDYTKLKRARERQLLTIVEAAQLCDVSETAYRLIEKGKAPWKKAIRAIAKELKVTDVVLPGRAERKSA